MNISRFEKWILIKIIKKVLQGHEKELSEFYELVHEQALLNLSAFPTESIDQYIRRCFEKSCGLEVYQEKKRKRLTKLIKNRNFKTC